MAKKTQRELAEEQRLRKEAREEVRSAGREKLSQKGQRVQGLREIGGTVPASIRSTQAYRAVKRAPKTAMELGALAVYGMEIRDYVKIERRAQRELMDYIAEHEKDDPNNQTQRELEAKVGAAKKQTLKKWQEAVDVGVGTKKEIADWVKKNYNSLTTENLSGAWQKARGTKFSDVQKAPRSVLSGTASLVNKAANTTLEGAAELYGRSRGLAKGEDLQGRDGRVIYAKANALRSKKRVAESISSSAQTVKDKFVKRMKRAEPDQILLNDSPMFAEAKKQAEISKRTGEFSHENHVLASDKKRGQISPYVDEKPFVPTKRGGRPTMPDI